MFTQARQVLAEDTRSLVGALRFATVEKASCFANIVEPPDCMLTWWGGPKSAIAGSITWRHWLARFWRTTTPSISPFLTRSDTRLFVSNLSSMEEALALTLLLPRTAGWLHSASRQGCEPRSSRPIDLVTAVSWSYIQDTSPWLLY